MKVIELDYEPGETVDIVSGTFGEPFELGETVSITVEYSYDMVIKSMTYDCNTNIMKLTLDNT